jgi:GNAT superfamily N-acetyltransferase
MNILKLDASSSREYFTAVARIHSEEIRFGFLPLLGTEFLSQLYFHMSCTKSSGVWAAEDNGAVIGFVTGTADIRQCYREIFKKAWLPLTGCVLQSIFKKDVLRKIPVILTYPFQAHAEEPSGQETQQSRHPELLSIAIKSGGKGKGTGRALVQALEQGLREWGETGVYYVSTNRDDPNSNAFYRHVGFTPVAKHKHNDLILQDYQKEIPLP